MSKAPILTCDTCLKNLSSSNINILNISKRFYKHNKSGHRCMNCKRFIPKSLSNDKNIICPYNCNFIGDINDLKSMHHPSEEFNDESLNDENKSLDKYKILFDSIDDHISNTFYNGCDYTSKYRELMGVAYKNLSLSHSEDMYKYFLENTRSGGFQHKLFQEFIRLLELSLPFTYKKGGKRFMVSSLLDDTIDLFDGISVFTSDVNSKCTIRNNTKEFYIGGRKGTYSQPYFIGKLLEVNDELTGDSLLSNVEYYTFNKIKLKNTNNLKKVRVSHLRIPPHYQMGAMVYLNRAKTDIYKRCLERLNNV